MNNKIKCAICGLTAIIFIESTPLCLKCHEEKYYDLPEKFCSSSSSMSTIDNFSTRTTIAVSGITNTTSTITTQQYY